MFTILHPGWHQLPLRTWTWARRCCHCCRKKGHQVQVSFLFSGFTIILKPFSGLVTRLEWAVSRTAVWTAIVSGFQLSTNQPWLSIVISSLIFYCQSINHDCYDWSMISSVHWWRGAHVRQRHDRHLRWQGNSLEDQPWWKWTQRKTNCSSDQAWPP